jgi:hypothetical protein
MAESFNSSITPQRSIVMTLPGLPLIHNSRLCGRDIGGSWALSSVMAQFVLVFLAVHLRE